jgi:hypothetical protein
MNRDCEALLHKEAVEVLGDRLPGFDDIAKLKYTQCVLKESLRFYPPAPLTARTLQEDLELEGHIIPKGFNMFLPIYYIHTHPVNWPDEPLKFKPGKLGIWTYIRNFKISHLWKTPIYFNIILTINICREIFRPRVVQSCSVLAVQWRRTYLRRSKVRHERRHYSSGDDGASVLFQSARGICVENYDGHCAEACQRLACLRAQTQELSALRSFH